MKSIFFKNFIITVCIFTVCFLLFSACLLFIGRSYIIEEKRETMYTSAEEINRSARSFHDGEGLSSLDLRITLTSVARSTGCTIFIVDTDGLILSCSDMEFDCPHIGKKIDSSVMSSVKEAGAYESLSTLNGILDSSCFVIASPISAKNGQPVLGYIFESYNASSLMDVWGAFLLIFTLLLLVALAISILIEFYTSKTHAKPLKDMVHAARSYSKGDFSPRIETYPGNNEISDLTVAFNSMAEALDETDQNRKEFIANVSHEVRTPITAIAGFADGMLDGTIPSDKYPDYLQRISSESKRLSRLVNSMLDVTRMQKLSVSDSFIRFNYSELLLQTFLNFEKKIEDKQINVDLNIPEEELYAFGNPDSITRVVYNILDNAIKFCTESGKLSIELWRESDKIFTCITDEGETIPADQISHIFDRFRKVDSSRGLNPEGVGLGLYLVKSILNSHNQKIFVNSKDGETAFTFTLQDEPQEPDNSPVFKENNKKHSPNS